MKSEAFSDSAHNEFNEVFIIDDDKIFHFIMKKLLLKKNIEAQLSFFENGLEAINDLKSRMRTGETIPDLILLDINMPVLDGWQFLEEYKRVKERLVKEPVIYLVSSSDNPMDIRKAREYEDEVYGYLLKPLTYEDIDSIFFKQKSLPE